MTQFITNEEELKDLFRGVIREELSTNTKEETILINREAVAKRLGVDVSTLWRWNKSGFLRVSTYLGRKPMYSSKVIERLERGEIEIK